MHAQRARDDENRVVRQIDKWTVEGTVKGDNKLSIL